METETAPPLDQDVRDVVDVPRLVACMAALADRAALALAIRLLHDSFDDMTPVQRLELAVDVVRRDHPDSWAEYLLGAWRGPLSLRSWVREVPS